MTLRITLRDGEQMVVNGAVLRARGRSELVIENHVAILRGREVMTPAEATTPARRLYLACMMAYIDPANRDAHHGVVVDMLGDLVAAFETPSAKAVCIAFAQAIAVGEHYRALVACRKLIDHETTALGRVEQAA